jgi:hypothetical protein
MSNKSKTVLVVVTAFITGIVAVAITSAMYTNSIGILGAKFSTQCPAKLSDYCQKWEIKSTTISEPDKHLQIPDEFRIKATRWGAEPPIWLVAKSALTTRWLNQSKIKLREIESAGNVDCMVGRVRLQTSHPGNTYDHEWHQLSVWPEKRPSAGSMIDVLAICVSKLDDGGWPNQCVRNTSCVNVDSRQNHGGRAHAENN